MNPNEEDQQQPDPNSPNQQNADNQAEPEKPRIQLGGVAPPKPTKYEQTLPNEAGTRPKVTMDMLEDESAPGPPNQTLVVGLTEEEQDTQDDKARQTYVIGPQRQEAKGQPAPQYVAASQSERPKNNIGMKLVFTLIILMLLAAAGYGVSLLV